MLDFEWVVEGWAKLAVRWLGITFGWGAVGFLCLSCRWILHPGRATGTSDGGKKVHTPAEKLGRICRCRRTVGKKKASVCEEVEEDEVDEGRAGEGEMGLWNGRDGGGGE